MTDLTPTFTFRASPSAVTFDRWDGDYSGGSDTGYITRTVRGGSTMPLTVTPGTRLPSWAGALVFNWDEYRVWKALHDGQEITPLTADAFDRVYSYLSEPFTVAGRQYVRVHNYDGLFNKEGRYYLHVEGVSAPAFN